MHPLLQAYLVMPFSDGVQRWIGAGITPSQCMLAECVCAIVLGTTPRREGAQTEGFTIRRELHTAGEPSPGSSEDCDTRQKD